MSEEQRQTFQREVEVQIDKEGRTLISRLVPYNEVATVNDGMGPYQERFVPGAFDSQMRAAHRIKALLNFRHRQSLSDVIGHATRIEDRDDGLHGELAVLECPDGDKALQLYDAGVLTKLSVEFQPVRDKVVDGITQRIKARLLGVALVPEGAYSSAEVLAVREEVPIVHVEKPAPMDPELVKRLERLGINTGQVEDDDEEQQEQ